MARILVVEDDDDIRFLILYHLQQHGFDVAEATDGTEALQQLGGSSTPDVIVTDLAMPRLNGVELARLLRRRSDDLAGVPIVVVTALPQHDPLVQKAATLSRTWIIRKPEGGQEGRPPDREPSPGRRGLGPRGDGRGPNLGLRRSGCGGRPRRRPELSQRCPFGIRNISGMDAAVATSAPPLSRPILQQFYDCSNPRARISGMVLVNLYADRGPQAIVFHDSEGLAASAYLTQVARALEEQFPGTPIQVTSHCLRDEPGVYRDVRLSRAAA